MWEEWKGWTLPAQVGQLQTGKDGKGVLRSYLFMVPNDLAFLWTEQTRLDYFMNCKPYFNYFNAFTALICCFILFP